VTIFTVPSGGGSPGPPGPAGPAGPAGPGMPTGSVVSFAGAVAPTDWLLCDGTIYLNTAFPALAALLGTTYGGVFGTSFGVPDARGRVLVGAGTGAGLTPRALAATGGEEAHALSASENGPHVHGVSDPGHDHQFLAQQFGTTSAGPFASGVAIPAITFSAVIATFTGSTTTKPTGASVDPSGLGTAHNTMQPFLVQNAIIKT